MLKYCFPDMEDARKSKLCFHTIQWEVVSVRLIEFVTEVVGIVFCEGYFVCDRGCRHFFSEDLKFETEIVCILSMTSIEFVT